MCKNPYDRFKWQMVRFSVCFLTQSKQNNSKDLFDLYELRLYKVQKCLILEVFLPSMSTGIKKKKSSQKEL